MTYKNIDEWLNEPEGFGLRIERTPDSSYSWIKEAWRLGGEAERERSEGEIGRLRAVVRVNLMRCAGATHEEIDRILDGGDGK